MSKRKRYATEEIIGKLREAEVHLAQGETVGQAVPRLLAIVDEHTRECLAIDVGRRLNSEHVLARLAELFVRRRVPEYIRSTTARSSRRRRCGAGSGGSWCERSSSNPVAPPRPVSSCRCSRRARSAGAAGADAADHRGQAAIHAPSGSNTQPWQFIVVRDQAVKDRLNAIYDDALAEMQGAPTPQSDSDRQPLSAAPVLIVACVDTPASGRAGFQTGASIYPACQNLMLTARALGLGTGLTTRHRVHKAEVHEVLGIPDGVESTAVIPLGWPNRDYGPNRRAPLDQFLHYDRW